MTSLYIITQLTANESSFSAEITFNPAHPVFSGHFPGQPIVPGVVLVEISATVISQLTGMELIVKEVSVIKFLQVIDPLQHPLVMIDGSVVEEDRTRYKVDLSFSDGGLIFAKLRGIRLQPLKEHTD
jgi:3-hydroxyacyl-[acyl-carrier-protein] dehydratase